MNVLFLGAGVKGCIQINLTTFITVLLRTLENAMKKVPQIYNSSNEVRRQNKISFFILSYKTFSKDAVRKILPAFSFQVKTISQSINQSNNQTNKYK